MGGVGLLVVVGVVFGVVWGLQLWHLRCMKPRPCDGRGFVLVWCGLLTWVAPGPCGQMGPGCVMLGVADAEETASRLFSWSSDWGGGMGAPELCGGLRLCALRPPALADRGRVVLGLLLAGVVCPCPT